MSQYFVLKELPKGQQPGDTVELNDDEARVFMTAGVDAVRPVDEPSVDAPIVEETSVEETKTRRKYQRRDLAAED